MRKSAFLIICLTISSLLAVILINNNNNLVSIQPEDDRIEDSEYIYKYQIKVPSGTKEAAFHIYTWEWKEAGTRSVAINDRKTFKIFF